MNYINTGKALTIIFGILLSVVVAFVCGAVVQFVSRLIFTFDYRAPAAALRGPVGRRGPGLDHLLHPDQGRQGGLVHHATRMLVWIKSHTGLILLLTFVGSALLLQILLSLTRVNILKLIVLVGTFALAMAFAANDLVNFIGVPLAGLSAYTVASGSGDMLTRPWRPCGSRSGRTPASCSWPARSWSSRCGSPRRRGP